MSTVRWMMNLAFPAFETLGVERISAVQEQIDGTTQRRDMVIHAGKIRILPMRTGKLAHNGPIVVRNKVREPVALLAKVRFVRR